MPTSGVTGERGSALILVMLVLLALSAVGMIGLRNVSRSVDYSGDFRIRTTAQMFSDAAGSFISQRLGDKARQIWGAMERKQQLKLEDHLSKLGTRESLVEQGAPLKLVQDRTENEVDFSTLLKAPKKSNETGLFSDGQHRSFESAVGQTRFEVVIRDPLSGIPVPGYSDRFCFKKVTVATKAKIGELKKNWDEPRQVGVGRTLFEGMIGPVECD
ncbi:MAG: hypothetical protein ABEL76_11845 [Bradymonadaceae bacterium]